LNDPTIFRQVRLGSLDRDLLLRLLRLRRLRKASSTEIIEVICAGMNDAAGTADNSQSVAYKLTSPGPDRTRSAETWS
jgi:hypothetical protein